MLFSSKHSKIIKIAVCVFMIASAIFLLANFVLAAGLDVGLEYAASTGLSNALDMRIIIARIIRIALGFLGIIAVGLVMYAGWLWMTSGGNEEKIEQAKKILQNAVIGLIIILLSFAIASFILNLLIGATTGGQNGPGNGPPSRYGLSALGNGIIQSHYPTRGQKEVPRNTSIIISFREPMKADTLCTNPVAQQGKPDKCDGVTGNQGNINEGVVGIFKQSDEANCIANNTPLASCPSFADAKVYSSDDNKTFVFVPINYLGSPSEYINYTVYLGKGLKRQTGEPAFASGFGRDYGWSFEVSNKIDLDPPKVLSNGVFPAPDNIKDTTVTGVKKQAKGTITVNSKPAVYSAASVSVSTANPNWSAKATVDNNCSQDDIFTVNIESDPSIIKLKDSSNRLLGQGTINGKTASFALCNLKLTLDNGSFVINSLWTVTIEPMIVADTIIVGNITYTASNERGDNHFRPGLTNADTALGIARVINPDSEVLGVTASNSGNTVIVTAKVAGAAGNNINLSSSNSTRLPVAAMANGKDKVDNVTVNGRTDQPMNTAIQINFNEAIMPLTVSGKSEDVYNFIRVVNVNSVKSNGDGCTADADCKSYKCESSKCVGDSLAGKFAVSNQYQTVEFLSDKECGFNNCGEKIYCLPANSHLRVELKAASLIPCASDANCVDKSPFNTCDSTREFCRDNVDLNKYFPQADKNDPETIINGLVDMVFNSLDGNRNDSAYGPDKFYNENAPVGVCESGVNKGDICTEANKVTVCGSDIGCFMDGDNYMWSFFISNILDLTPPKIKTTTPIINGVNVPLADKITIPFDKVMLSSRLTTGSLMIQNGQQNIQHYLLNLRSLADQPVGYWVTNAGQLSSTGEIVSTDAYINHSSFSPSATYKAQAGSGLKDIYQNCFLPCSSESLTGIPSCCNGVPQDKATCP